MSAYQRFVQNVRFARKEDGPDFFEFSNYTHLTRIEQLVAHVEPDDDYVMEVDDNDEDWEDFDDSANGSLNNSANDSLNDSANDSTNGLGGFTTPKSKGGRPTKLGKVSPKTLQRRLLPILLKLKKLCAELGLEMYQILGLIGRRFYNTAGKNNNYGLGQMFDQVFAGIDTSRPEVPIDLALFTMVFLQMGDRKYHHLAKTLAKYVRLPPKNRVRKRKHQIVPKYENTRNQGTILTPL